MRVNDDVLNTFADEYLSMHDKSMTFEQFLEMKLTEMERTLNG